MSKIYKEYEFSVYDIKPIAIQFDEFTSVQLVSTPYGDGVAIYKDGTGSDLSSTHMPTGTASVSDNIFTTAPIRSLVGGHYYIVAIVVTVNETSQQEHVYCKLNVVNEKSGLTRTR